MTRKMWWWCTGKHNGQTILMGKYATEEEADEVAFEAFKEEPYEKHYLPTSSRSECTRMLKHKLLVDSGDLDSSLQKFRHGIKPEEI